MDDPKQSQAIKAGNVENWAGSVEARVVATVNGVSNQFTLVKGQIGQVEEEFGNIYNQIDGVTNEIQDVQARIHKMDRTKNDLQNTISEVKMENQCIAADYRNLVDTLMTKIRQLHTLMRAMKVETENVQDTIVKTMQTRQKKNQKYLGKMQNKLDQ